MPLSGRAAFVSLMGSMPAWMSMTPGTLLAQESKQVLEVSATAFAAHCEVLDRIWPGIAGRGFAETSHLAL
jgi:hypothetical protein